MDEIKQTAAELSRALGVSELFASLLVKRGITDEGSARSYLYPSLEEIEDPFRLTGMREAVDRIRAAVEAKEKVVIYGDYDCDGITATSILYDYLSSLGADVSYYIPNRFDTGYGLTVETLEEIAETEFPDLLITVDCGISSVEEAEYLDEVLAIDLIVTDHHTLPDTLPRAIVVNPKLDPESRATDLCGAGVAFKVVQALGGVEAAWKYIELAAIATVADIVPLVKENRLIASLGLAKINSREKINKGLRLLIESIGFKEPITATNVGFQIAPRINALGRLDDCSEVVTLFTTEEYVVLEGLIEKLTRMNEVRKSSVQTVCHEALEMLKEYDLATHKIIFLYKADWNPGVLGLVAGRLKNDFCRPVVLVSGEDDLKGSARSPEGVDMYETLKSAAPLLVKFGGHKRAAGLTVKRENLIAARNAMDAYLDTLPTDVFSREERYDAELSPEQVTVSFAEEIALLEPTGEGNPKAIFKFSTRDYPLTPIGNGLHVKGRINDQAELIGFNLAYVAEGADAGVEYDLLCECSKEVYKNRAKAQLRVESVYSRGMREQRSSLALFNRYLRSNLYKEEKCAFTAVSVSEMGDLFYDDDFATLFLALSPENVGKTAGDPRVRHVEYGRSVDAPWNEVILAPESDPVGYKRIILLDTPLTTGYVARLAKATGAEVYVVKDNYPYADAFRAVDLSVDRIAETYEKVRRFVYSGNGAASPLDLASKLAPDSSREFLVHFYVLFESGSISIGQGFALSPRPFVDPAESVLYRRISALKRKL